MVVSVTSIREGDPNNTLEALRARVFLDTAQRHNRLGLPLFAVYVDCSEAYLAAVRSLGVSIEAEQRAGMGLVRRQALTSASFAFPSAEYFLWCEPEKPGLADLVYANYHTLISGAPHACFFNRLSMDSYPLEQAHYYLFVRAVASALLGFDFDYGFGPMIVGRKALHYFTEYTGEYGDLWDSILIPRLRLMFDRASYKTVTVQFQNDARMTRSESSVPNIILKRLHQLDNIIPSLIAELMRLNIHCDMPKRSFHIDL